MAGQLTIDTLRASSGVLATQNGMTGITKAWVQWNGNGSVTIRASFNVSSVTYNGTGDYTINFTTAMADANYSAVGSSAIADDGTFTEPVMQTKSVGGNALVTPTTTALRLTTQGNGGSAGARNTQYVNVAVFGN